MQAADAKVLLPNLFDTYILPSAIVTAADTETVAPPRLQLLLLLYFF
ncbi:MAG: hypothetical protein F6K22_25230 [Okeania sp. SIO2F4]|nr:hypothetical protein [Okeania sp. SIO2F4]NES05819.1 hypothetical protein [Okeania sp. SIO2F4]